MKMETLKKAFYSRKELNGIGITDYRIKQMVNKNQLIKISSSYYENADYKGLINDYNYVPMLIKNGVVCLLSAASYYGYTTYRPLSIDVAVPQGSNYRGQYDYPPITLHYLVARKYNIGITTIQDDVNCFKIFSKERTVCDILMNRTKIESEEIKNVLTGYLYDEESNLNKLYIMAEKLKCLRILETYMEVLL